MVAHPVLKDRVEVEVVVSEEPDSVSIQIKVSGLVHHNRPWVDQEVKRAADVLFLNWTPCKCSDTHLDDHVGLDNFSAFSILVLKSVKLMRLVLNVLLVASELSVEGKELASLDRLLKEFVVFLEVRNVDIHLNLKLGYLKKKEEKFILLRKLLVINIFI